MAIHTSTKIDYQMLAEDEQDEVSLGATNRCQATCHRPLHRPCVLIAAVVILLSAATGFIVGAIWMHNGGSLNGHKRSSNTAPQVPIPDTEVEFIYASPFSIQPPQGEESEEEPEPVWDTLVPSKLPKPQPWIVDLLEMLRISSD